MKYNFKKISAMGCSLLLAGMSVAAPIAAANYPAPFVVSGNADVSAIVYGANAATLDGVLAGQINEDLNAYVTTGSSGGGGSVTGEAVALFSGGTKIYVNDSLNAVKNVLTKAVLPTVLKDESFSGNVDTTITQTIVLGSDPRVTFKKQPTSSDYPQYALQIATTGAAKYIYNATAIFSKAVQFNHSDSEGEDITLFGQKYTVASATSATDLVLLQSAEKISLDSDNPIADVTIAGVSYTIELVSSSDDAATIKVTDSTGDSDTRTVSEAASKKINGLTVAVTTADETNFKLSATLVAGSEKITLVDGSTITFGEDDASIEGATAYFVGGVGAMTRLTVSVFAPESDMDAIKMGEVFIDPVFKSFKLDFAGFNIPSDLTDSAREDISFANNGDDKMEITFTDHTLNTKTIMFAKNTTGSPSEWKLFADDDNRNFSVMEAEVIHRNDYIVVGNEEEGHLLRLSSVKNDSTGTNNDKAWFTDMFTGDILKTTWTTEGVGTMTVGGKSFGITLQGGSGSASETYTVRVNQPDSSGAGVALAYPTIRTSKGANLFFYEPVTIANLSLWDGSNAMTELKIPDGDGYTSLITAMVRDQPAGADGMWNYTVVGGSLTSYNTTLGTGGALGIIGQLTFTVNTTGNVDELRIRLKDVGGKEIMGPAVVIFEEKDDGTNYEALIVKLDDGATSDDGVGIDDVERTWSGNSGRWETTVSGNSKLELSADKWGTIISTDTSDSDQKTVIISYPDEQIYAQIYIGEIDSVVTAATTGSSGGTSFGYVVVSDSEAASMGSKNMIVVGGSCINTATAKVLGVTPATCSEAFTTATGVGSGQFLIQSVADAYTVGKVAVVVAGYEVAQTQMATTYLTTKKPDLAGGNKYIGTSSTSATLQTAAA